MNQTEESRIKLIIDGEDAERSLAGLRQEAREITAEMRRDEENTDAYRELATQKKQLNVETREYIQNLDLENASVNELRAKKRLLNNELKDLKTNSDAWLDKLGEITQVDAKLDAAKAEMNALNKATDENVSTWGRLKDTFVSTFGAFLLDDVIQEVVEFGKESIQAAAETSDAFADVQKSTGMTADEVQGLNDQIAKIDTRTAQAQLLEIAKVGGPNLPGDAWYWLRRFPDTPLPRLSKATKPNRTPARAAPYVAVQKENLHRLTPVVFSFWQTLAGVRFVSFSRFQPGRRVPAVNQTKL